MKSVAAVREFPTARTVKGRVRAWFRFELLSFSVFSIFLSINLYFYVRCIRPLPAYDTCMGGVCVCVCV